VRAGKHLELNDTSSQTAEYCEFTSNDCPVYEFREGGEVTMVRRIRGAFESPQTAEKAAYTRAVAIQVPTARGHYARSIHYGTVSSVKSEKADHGPL